MALISITTTSITPTGTTFQVYVGGIVDTTAVTGNHVVVGLYLPPATQPSYVVTATVTPGTPVSSWVAVFTGVAGGTYNVDAAIVDSGNPPTIIDHVILNGLVVAVATGD